MKILIVDDNPTSRTVLRVLFIQECHTVVEAEDGLEALAMLERENIDAVISDILMPRMDGYRLCYEIRQNPKFNSIPFIAYSATYTSPHDERVALDFGADRFLTKPALREVVIKALHEVVEKRASRTRNLRVPDELSAMKEYSETLVRKLEETNAELSQANQALNERAVLAEFVADISNALNHSETLPVILQLCTEAMVRRLNAAFARIWTYNANDDVLELQASAGMYTHINGGHGRVPVGQFKIGLIASERNAHLTNSVIGDPRVNDQEWAKREGMVAFAGYPLLIEDNLVGVMAMFSRQPLMASTLQAMESVSNVIAASILRKRINDEKQRETERSRAIMETALDCIITMDHEGKILEFNPAAERTFGYTRSTIIGKELAALIIPPHLRERHRRGLAHYLTTGNASMFGKRIDITAMRSDGSEFPVELMISPMTIGERATFTGFIRDISERKRAEEHIQRNIERMEALREIEKSITSTLDLNTVLNVLLEKIDIFFAKSSAAIVRLFDRDTGQLEPVAARNIEISEWIAAMPGVQDNSKSYAGVVIEQRAPLVIANLQTDSRTQNPRFFGEHGLISYAGVPLIAKGEVLGVLGIYTKEQHCFSSEEIELLMILAGHTAIAIHNAQLFQTIEASKQQLASMNQFLEHALNKLGSLYTAMTPLALSESLGEMVNAIIERLIEATGADAALIRIWDLDTGKYPVIGHRGYTDDFVEGLRPERADGAVQWVIKHGEPIIAPDLSSEVRFRGKRQVDLGFQSCTILPVRVHGDIRGVIQLSSRKQRYFDDEQKDYLMAVARQMSVALENRELFYNLQASRNELERANKVKDEFLNVMSHELRTPLSVVVGYSTMLREQQSGPLTKGQEQAVDIIQRNSKELFTMIDSIMNATKIEAGSMIAEKGAVSPGELLAELKAIYEFPTGKNVRFEWRFSETLRSLWTDGRKLRQILTNLINNAVKFTDEGSIVISAEEKLEGLEDDEGCHRGWIQFRVSDSGIGIPAEERDKIFERFHQVDSSAARSFEGVGLGLYIVKSFTEMLNGRVSVSSAVGHGSTFTVQIPCESIPIARGNCYIKEESTIGPPAIVQ